MFGPGGIAGVNRMRKQAADAGPPIGVTADELRALFVGNGMSEKDAKFQVNVTSVLSGNVLIGGKLYYVKK